MDRDLQTIENALSRLGEARQAGAFSAAKGDLPWQAAKVVASKKATHRFVWVRVAASLAAAAAIAVVFVLPNVLNPRQAREIAGNLPVAAPSQMQHGLAEALVSSAPVHRDECDYNGDGSVDGLDIQALVTRLNDTPGDPHVDVEKLQRCLLRS